MQKYDDIKKIIDNQSFLADDYASAEEYNLVLSISKMYHELKQIKLSYERLLKTEKGKLIMAMVHARQSLYNAISDQPRKQVLIDGINYAIKDLDEILLLERGK